MDGSAAGVPSKNTSQEVLAQQLVGRKVLINEF